MIGNEYEAQIFCQVHHTWAWLTQHIQTSPIVWFLIDINIMAHKVPVIIIRTTHPTVLEHLLFEICFRGQAKFNCKVVD